MPLHGSGQSERRACERYWLDGLGCKGKAAFPTCHSSTCVHDGNLIAFFIKNGINQGHCEGAQLCSIPGDFPFPFPSCQSCPWEPPSSPHPGAERFIGKTWVQGLNFFLTIFLCEACQQISYQPQGLKIVCLEISAFNRTHMANMKEGAKGTAGEGGSIRWMLAFTGGGDAFRNWNKIHPMLLQENYFAYCLKPPEVTGVSH